MSGKIKDEFALDANTFESNSVEASNNRIRESMNSEAKMQQSVNESRARLAKEVKEKVRIAPAYKPYLGNNCQIMINGVAIVVPCDGSFVDIPESYAAELYSRMAKIDALIERQLKMSNYSANREHVIGEIRF